MSKYVGLLFLVLCFACQDSREGKRASFFYNITIPEYPPELAEARVAAPAAALAARYFPNATISTVSDIGAVTLEIEYEIADEDAEWYAAQMASLEAALATELREEPRGRVQPGLFRVEGASELTLELSASPESQEELVAWTVSLADALGQKLDVNMVDDSQVPFPVLQYTANASTIERSQIRIEALEAFVRSLGRNPEERLRGPYYALEGRGDFVYLADLDEPVISNLLERPYSLGQLGRWERAWYAPSGWNEFPVTITFNGEVEPETWEVLIDSIWNHAPSGSQMSYRWKPLRELSVIISGDNQELLVASEKLAAILNGRDGVDTVLLPETSTKKCLLPSDEIVVNERFDVSTVALIWALQDKGVICNSICLDPTEGSLPVIMKMENLPPVAKGNDAKDGLVALPSKMADQRTFVRIIDRNLDQVVRVDVAELGRNISIPTHCCVSMDGESVIPLRIIPTAGQTEAEMKELWQSVITEVSLPESFQWEYRETDLRW